MLLNTCSKLLNICSKVLIRNYCGQNKKYPLLRKYFVGQGKKLQGNKPIALDFRQQFLGMAHHCFGHWADRFQKVRHLPGIDLRHALAGIEEGGMAQVGKAVAHF